MPGYNIHRLFNYAILIAFAFVLSTWDIPAIDLKQFIVFIGGYYIGTDLLTPDIDTESAAIKRWGRLKILFLPYKWMFTHRQSSHNILYGGAVRILYISIIIFSAYYILFKSLPSGMIFSSIYIYIFVIGIIIANALHIILDAAF